MYSYLVEVDANPGWLGRNGEGNKFCSAGEFGDERAHDVWNMIKAPFPTIALLIVFHK